MRHMGGYSDMTIGRAASGPEALAMRIWHIVETPPGRMPQDPTAGWGLTKRLGKKTASQDLKMEAAIGRAAIKKDREVRDAIVRISPRSDAPSRFRVQITVYPIEGGSFEIDREVGT